MDFRDIENRELHRVATTAIIYNDEGKYLITKRAPHKKHFPNVWTVPGGGLTIDDYINSPLTHNNQWYYSLTKGLMREIKEETGLEVDKPEYLLDLTFIKEDKVPVLVLSYFAKYLSGEVVLDEDSVDYKWILPEELPNFELIKGIDEEILMVDKILKQRRNG